MTEVPGIDPTKLPEVLQRISPIAAKRTSALASEPPGGGFRLQLVLKEMELATTTSMGSPPVLEAVEDVCRAAVEKGLGDVDLSGLGSAARDHKERT